MNAKGSLSLQNLGLPTTALRSKVAMPTATTDSGEAGQYAIDGDKLAIYLDGTGWIFFTGFQV